MKIDQQTETITELYRESSDKEMFRSISKLLKILSKEHSLLILSITKNGMKADTLACNKIGLTKKQYYTSLMQLKSEGLIEKNGSSYLQTTLGSFICENCINVLLSAMKNRKQMAMVDVLRRSNKFSEDITRIKDFVCKIMK